MELKDMNLINTRIALKIDTLENWQTHNPELLPGEVAFVQIGSVTTDKDGKRVIPPVMFKVGPGNFNSLGWGAAKAADVYDWAKLLGSQVFEKDGTGNVISGITFDQSLNDGKGGFKYSTASVATSEGLKDVQDDLAALEAEVYGVDGSAGDSRIDRNEVAIAAIEKDIRDNRDTWALDTDTTYSFAVEDKQLVIKKTVTTNGVAAAEVSVGSYDLIDDIVIVDADKEERPGCPITGISWDDTKNELTVTRENIDGDYVYLSENSGAFTVREYISHRVADAEYHMSEQLQETNDRIGEVIDLIEELPEVVGGAGIKATTNTGSGIHTTTVSANFKFNDELVNNKLQIVDKDNEDTVLAEFDASEFIKDGFLSSVTKDTTTNEIVFNWNTDAGITETRVDIDELVEVYTGGELISIEDWVVNHVVPTGAAAGKTMEGAQTPDYSGSFNIPVIETDKFGHVIGKGTTTVTLPAPIDISNKKDKQDAVGNKITDKAHVLTSLTQNENGVIGYDVKVLTPEDIGAQAAGDYKTTQKAKEFAGSTIKTVTKVAQNANGEVDVTYEEIAFPAAPVGSGDVAIATKENDIITLNGSVKLDDHSLVDGEGADITLAKIAATGSIYDVTEGSHVSAGTDAGIKYLVFNCGSATTVI